LVITNVFISKLESETRKKYCALTELDDEEIHFIFLIFKIRNMILRNIIHIILVCLRQKNCIVNIFINLYY